MAQQKLIPTSKMTTEQMVAELESMSGLDLHEGLQARKARIIERLRTGATPTTREAQLAATFFVQRGMERHNAAAAAGVMKRPDSSPNPMGWGQDRNGRFDPLKHGQLDALLAAGKAGAAAVLESPWIYFNDDRPEGPENAGMCG